MGDLRIGVLGCGGRGAIARHAHQPGQGSRVVACFDIDKGLLAQQKNDYGSDVLITRDVSELFRLGLDAVFICTPDYLHEEHAVSALESGLTVYLEKPMAITIAGCDRILTTAVRTGSRLFVGHNMRHMTSIHTMKTLIEEGAIGEVKTAWCRHFVGKGGDFYFKDWHADRRHTTSLLLQKACHDIDVLHWLCGGYSQRVNAMGAITLYDQITDKTLSPIPWRQGLSVDNWPPLNQTGMNPIITVEDLSMMQMRLDNGVYACYQQCNYTPDYWRNYTIIGTEGRLENFGDSQPGAIVKLWNRRVDRYSPEADETFDVSTPTDDHGGADQRIVHEFLHYAREGGTPRTSPLAARHSVAAGYCATESLRNDGIPIDVPQVNCAIANYFN
jgi:predicted dehydrogenase